VWSERAETHTRRKARIRGLSKCGHGEEYRKPVRQNIKQIKK